MSAKKKQGFAALTPDQLREVSSRGGQYKGPKGFASLTDEQKRANSSRAATIRWARVRQERAESEAQGDVTTEVGDGQTP